jgi:hypothetical protein
MSVPGLVSPSVGGSNGCAQVMSKPRSRSEGGEVQKTQTDLPVGQLVSEAWGLRTPLTPSAEFYLKPGLVPSLVRRTSMSVIQQADDGHCQDTSACPFGANGTELAPWLAAAISVSRLSSVSSAQLNTGCRRAERKTRELVVHPCLPPSGMLSHSIATAGPLRSILEARER